MHKDDKVHTSKVTIALCQLAAEILTTFMPAKASINLGSSQSSKSPCPNCPRLQ